MDCSSLVPCFIGTAGTVPDTYCGTAEPHICSWSHRAFRIIVISASGTPQCPWLSVCDDGARDYGPLLNRSYESALMCTVSAPQISLASFPRPPRVRARWFLFPGLPLDVLWSNLRQSKPGKGGASLLGPDLLPVCSWVTSNKTFHFPCLGFSVYPWCP